MSRPVRPSTLVLLLLLIGAPLTVACDGSDAGATVGSAATGESAAASASEGELLDETIEKQECTLLSADDVAAVVGVPADRLEQMSVSGCIYEWDNGSVYVNLSHYDTVERARTWFERFTQDATAEEIAEAKDQLDERMDEKVREGEITEEEAETVRPLSDLIPEMAVTEQAVEGLGDEASVENSGSLRVLYRNVMFETVVRTGDENEDRPELAIEIARIVVDNLAAL